MPRKVIKSERKLFPAGLLIYEVNTWIWLNELSRKYRMTVTLGNVPPQEWDHIATLGFNAVWLMGVWERSRSGLEIAKQHEGIMNDLREALPDLREEDIAGSPYCVRDYHADEKIGGDKELEAARQALSQRGIRLILDFVPNHVAPDHPWTHDHPVYFIAGSEDELAQNPESWYRSGKKIFARARDPFYPAWPDVLQLNVFHEGFRKEMIRTLKMIAAQCDGIRCDMAMLVMNDIFAKTWGEKAGPAPENDFWPTVIAQVKKQFPEFLFIAESYWDMEKALIDQGFDFCYDKKHYDFLKEGSVQTRDHLAEMENIQDHLLRFLENHDEPRAARLFRDDRNKALAVASLTLPGARLLHDGQLEGRKIRVPVFLSRRPDEKENVDLKRFYLQLLKIQHYEAVRLGKWSVCSLSGWPDNQTCLNLLAWEWISEHENLLIVVNLSDQPAQAHVRSGHQYQPGNTYQLFDVPSGELYRRDGSEMNDPGLYVVLKAWGFHVMSIEK